MLDRAEEIGMHDAPLSLFPRVCTEQLDPKRWIEKTRRRHLIGASQQVSNLSTAILLPGALSARTRTRDFGGRARA
jgi:hypothetical protein